MLAAEVAATKTGRTKNDKTNRVASKQALQVVSINSLAKVNRLIIGR